MQIVDRLFVFFRENNLSNYRVEQECGLSNGYLRHLKKAPSVEILEKIFSAFPELNRNWVMTGEGSMLREPEERKLISDSDEIINALKLTISTQQKTIDAQEMTIQSLMDQIKMLKGGASVETIQDMRVG